MEIPEGWNTEVQDFVDVSTETATMQILKHLEVDEQAAEFFISSHSFLKANSDIYYRNQYSTMAAAIFAVANYGVRGIQRAPDRWSDVVLPTWKNIAERYEGAAHDLEYVIQLTILNDDTNELLKELIPAQDRRGPECYWDFTPHDDGFYGKSIIHTDPNKLYIWLTPAV